MTTMVKVMRQGKTKEMGGKAVMASQKNFLLVSNLPPAA